MTRRTRIAAWLALAPGRLHAQEVEKRGGWL